MARWISAGAALAVALFWCPSAAAQERGRWWWDGSLGIGQRTYDNLVDEQRVSRFDQQDLRAKLGLNGFLGDPVRGRFRLGLDLLFSEIEGGRGLDEERIGADAELNLYPRGRFPARLFFQREIFDFTGFDPEDPFALVALPDTSTRWGGQLQLRSGFLKGTLLGLERNTVKFLAPGSDDDLQDRQYIEWSRSSLSFQHHLRLERLLREYGTVGLQIEDFNANLDERGELGASWNWQMSGIGIRRRFTSPSGVESENESLRLRNRMFQTVRSRDLLDLNYALDLARPESRSTSQGHDLLIIYRWRPTLSWEVAPFSQYLHQTSGPFSLRSPRAGVAITFGHSGTAFDTTWTGRASYGQTELSDGDTSVKDSDQSLFLSATLGHGESSRLRKELEFEVARNEVRMGSDPILDLPDLGFPLRALGTEDRARGRLTVDHRWGPRWVQVWGEWSYRESVGERSTEDFESENLTATLQIGSGRLNLAASAGQTDVVQEISGEQEVSFQSATASLRLWRLIDLRGVYRTDTRRLVLAPDIDGQLIEAILRIRLGAFAMQAVAFEYSESLFAGPERTNRGVVWSLSRNFAGRLPIVTGTQRRGVIR